MRAAGRTVAALVAALAALLLPAAGPPPATAATKPCVGVIVDARLLGGAVTTGCATGDPDSGLDALTRAGFRYAFVPRQPGLVCQIGGAPACEDTGATTYWSYWHRAKGSSTWTYSTVGAAGYDPEPGSTEAWVWQDGGRRRPPDVALRTICPQAFPTSTPSTAKARQSATTRTSETPTRRTTSAPARPGGADPASPAATAEALPSAPGPSATPAPSSSADPIRGASRPPDASPDAAPDAAPVADRGAGRWTGVAIGVALVALLGAGTLARHRRPGGRP